MQGGLLGSMEEEAGRVVVVIAVVGGLDPGDTW